MCVSPVRAAWATNYCPGAFNSADCVVDSSVNVCDGTTWATDIVCDLHYAEGASTLTAVSNYVGGDISVWGTYHNNGVDETYCCHYTVVGNNYDYVKIDGSDYADTIKLTYTSGTEYNLDAISLPLHASVSLFGGNDLYVGSNATDATGYDESCSGNDGDDTMSGGNGDDSLHRDAGADTMLGGPGEDDVDGGADNDSIVGGMGNDYVNAQAGDDAVSGGDGDDVLIGGDGADVLCGGAGTGDDMDAGDDTFENPLYDKFWDTDGSVAYCGSDGYSRKGGGGVTASDCSSYALLAPPACP